MSKPEYIPLASTSSQGLTAASLPSNRNRQQNNHNNSQFLKLTSRPLSRSNSNSSNRSMNSSITDVDDDHERRGFLPSSYRGRNGALILNSSGRVWSRIRGGRIRWLALLSLFTLIMLIWSTGKGGVIEKVREKGLKIVESTGKITLDNKDISDSTQTGTSDSTISTSTPETTTLPTSPFNNLPINVNVFSTPSTPTKIPLLESENFLSYTPHSGYHNQRISLENALTLAFMLNRTLLLPPVWVGSASIPFISYDKLQRRIQIANKVGLERCKMFGEGGSEDVLPRECEGYFDWTTIGWEFFINLDKVKEKVSIRNRLNMTREWLEEELELDSNIKQVNKKKGKEENDTFFIKDAMMYDSRYYDSEEDAEPLDKFSKRRDIGKLKESSDPFKLLSIGSLFGTSRIRVTQEENFNARSFFRKAMVFKTPIIDEIVEDIRDRLGGSGNYFGLHLRVGDGVFQHEAKKNTATIFQQLCTGKMKLSQSVCDKASLVSKPAKRSNVEDSTRNHTRRATNSRPQKDGAYNHKPLPPLPIITDRSNSLLHQSLTCRLPFHKDKELLPFNAPLFIATDSKLPSSDPNLSIFFNAFPCTFILNDFNSISPVNSVIVNGLDQLSRLRNSEDLVPLAQFLYPQLDAQISAYGRHLIGTPQSTYSRFATDVLHQVYHGWEIIERG